jgi:hypothetical protein
MTESNKVQMKKLNTAPLVVVAVTALTLGWFLGQWFAETERVDRRGEDVLATVGATEIDLAQYRSAMRRFGGLKPGQYQTLDQKRMLLGRLIRQSVLVSAALAEGLDQDPEVLHVWNKILADRYVELNLNPRIEAIEISDSEIENYYAENQRKYVRPARRRAALILRRVGTDSDEARWQEEKQKMADARTAATQLDPDLSHFSTVATEFSQDRGSRYVGGVIGWFVNHPGRSYKWHQRIIDALYELENVGDISPVIELPDGFALVRLVDAEAQQEKAYAAVSSGVRNKLLHERQLQEKEAFKAELTERVSIDVNEELLASVEPLSGKQVKGDKKPPALPSG